MKKYNGKKKWLMVIIACAVTTFLMNSGNQGFADQGEDMARDLKEINNTGVCI